MADVSPNPDPEVLWLRRGDQLFVGVMVAAATVLLGLFWLRAMSSGQPLIQIEHLPKHQYDYQLDVNESEWIEWTLLEGIGEKLARRIVADREANGRFSTVEDVDRVPGIGPKTLERIKPWLTVSPPRK